MSGRIRLLVATAGALLALPAGAAATTRYATPAGSATDPACAAAAPCTLQHAVAVAQSGEDVQLAPGDYALGADPSCAGALQLSHVYVHGVLGRPRPRIVGPPTACVAVELGDFGALSDLEVDGNNGFGHALGVNAFSRAFRVVTGGTNGTVWVQRGGRLLDSIARAGNQVDAIATYNSLQTDGTTIVNDTAIGRVDVVADTNDQAWLDVRNTIATGGFRVFCDGGAAQGHIALDSFFGAVSTSGACASVDQQLNSAGSGNPGLIADDWHELPGSALHDVGNDAFLVPADPNYATDIDGGARKAGAKVDIGADELGSALPTLAGASASQVTDSGAVVTAQIAPNGVDTGAYVEYGPTTDYGARSATVPAGAGFGFGDVAIPLAGLQPDTAYHFRAVTSNGTIAGDDGTFQTLAGPPAPPPPPQPPLVVVPVRILSPVRAFWVQYRRYVVLRRLRIAEIPAGAAVEVRCRGRGCPFRRRAFPVRDGRANPSVAVRKGHLRHGTALQVRITRPDAIGKVVKYVVPRRGLPQGRVRCLPPGATKPIAC